MACTVFLVFSVFAVAISARMSLISSLTSELPSPSTHMTCKILDCRKGSLMPAMSYSYAYPECNRFFKVFFRLAAYFLMCLMVLGSTFRIS